MDAANTLLRRLRDAHGQGSMIRARDQLRESRVEVADHVLAELLEPLASVGDKRAAGPILRGSPADDTSIEFSPRGVWAFRNGAPTAVPIASDLNLVFRLLDEIPDFKLLTLRPATHRTGYRLCVEWVGNVQDDYSERPMRDLGRRLVESMILLLVARERLARAAETYPHGPAREDHTS